MRWGCSESSDYVVSMAVGPPRRIDPKCSAGRSWPLAAVTTRYQLLDPRHLPSGTVWDSRNIERAAVLRRGNAPHEREHLMTRHWRVSALACLAFNGSRSTARARVDA